MKISYFQRGQGYVAVTNESPKQFKGVLFVGKGGPIDNIVEEAFERGQLAKLRAVELSKVPNEWVIALGYDKPVTPEPEEPEVFDTVLDDEGENVVAILPRPRRTRRQQVTQAPRKSFYDAWFYAGMAIGAIITFYVLARF